MKRLLQILALVFVSQTLFAQQFSNPISFIKNEGQIVDQNGKLNTNVNYVLPTNNGMNVQLLGNGFSYDVYKTHTNSVIFNRIDITFEHCNPKLEIIETDFQSQRSNYYKAGENQVSQSNIGEFKTITYKNVYPLIDIVFKTTQNGVKYDIILNPGAKIDDIRFKYSGIDGFNLEDNQTLNLSTQIRELQENIPLSFYKDSKKEVEVNFELHESNANSVVIGFKSSSKLKSSKTLIIDPVPEYVWSKYQGDSLITTTTGVITDRHGYAYVCGKTLSLTNIATTGAYQDTIYNLYDSYIRKYNNGGGLLWSTYFGGNGDDLANDVYVDTSFHVYLLGTTFSEFGLIDTLGSQDSLGGASDAFLARFTTDGELVWSTYLGGDSLDSGIKLSIDYSENIYVSGQTQSTDSIAFGNTYQSTLNGISDGFIAKYNSAGVLQWSTYLGGINSDIATGISFGDTSVFVTGQTNSIDFPVTVNAHKSILTGSTDGFISKFNAYGNLVWSTYFGGELDDNVSSVKVLNNNVFFIGSTDSDSSIVTSTAFQLTKNDSTDAFVGKMNRDGVLKWCSYYGGDSTDLGVDLFFELDSNILITGTTYSVQLAGITADTYQSENGGESDVFISKITKDGALEWSTFYGGTEEDEAETIAVYGNTAIYVVGSSQSDTAIVENDQINLSNEYNSELEGFVTKFKQSKSTPAGNCGGSCGANNYFQCIGDTILLTVIGGELGTDAQWYWYADSCGGSPYVGVGDSISLVIYETTTFYVRPESITNTNQDCASGTVLVAPYDPIFITNDSIVCQGEEFVFSHSTNGTANWFGPNNFSSTLSSITIDPIDTSYTGMYYIDAVDNYGCPYSDTLDLVVNPSPNVSSTVINPDCFGYSNGEMSFTGDSLDNYTFNWTVYDSLSSTPIVAHDSLLNIGSGTYAVTVLNEFNCSYIDSFVISQPSSALLDTTISPTLCLDSTGIIVLDLHQSYAPYSIIWSPTNEDDDTITDLYYGWHHVTITADNKCVENHSFFISNYNNFEASIIESTLSACPDVPTGSATATGVNGTEPFTYDWIGINQTTETATNIDTGYVIVYVYDNSGCYAFDSVYIGAQHTLEVEALLTNSQCGNPNGSISISVDSPSDYDVVFSNGVTNQLYIENLTEGMYSVTVTDTFGCNFYYEYEIEGVNNLEAWINPSDTTLTIGNPVTIGVNSNSLGNLFYNWTPTINLECSTCQSGIITPMSAGSYSVIVTDEFGCVDTAYFNFDVAKVVPVPVIPCVEVFIPSMFSPNNDQLNDRWTIIGSCIQSIRAKVFNQWGELIFESNELNNNWDGFYKGSKVMNDNYTYTVSITYDDGTGETFNGSVTVID